MNIRDFFRLVFLTDSKLSKIDRINTWLTCEWGCPAFEGSNNIQMHSPANDLDFRVYVHLPGRSINEEIIKEGDLRIHYEIQGPCEQNN